MTILEYLRTAVAESMSLPDLVDTFEEMCHMPIETHEDLVLFETGTFDFTGEHLFYFSLVRQFPNDDDEFTQVHLDVLYKPTKTNAAFHDQIWSDDLSFEGDHAFFDQIRQSQAYRVSQNDPIVRVNVWMSDT